jgi:hypothetical protein
MINNEATKKQIRDEFQKAIDDSKNPDNRKILIDKRKKKAKKIKSKFGL